MEIRVIDLVHNAFRGAGLIRSGQVLRVREAEYGASILSTIIDNPVGLSSILDMDGRRINEVTDTLSFRLKGAGL